MTHSQIWGMILAMVLVFTFFYGCYLAVKHIYKMKISTPPPAQFSRYRTPRPTIETQYGRDLLKISTEIYITHIPDAEAGDQAGWAVQEADNILKATSNHCSKIDKQKHEETNKRSREFMEKYLDATNRGSQKT